MSGDFDVFLQEKFKGQEQTKETEREGVSDDVGEGLIVEEDEGEEDKGEEDEVKENKVVETVHETSSVRETSSIHETSSVPKSSPAAPKGYVYSSTHGRLIKEIKKDTGYDKAGETNCRNDIVMDVSSIF